MIELLLYAAIANLALQPADGCLATPPSEVRVDSTFGLRADLERPEFSSETTMTVSRDWVGAEPLTHSPTTNDFLQVISCLFPKDSLTYRDTAPVVSLSSASSGNDTPRLQIVDNVYSNWGDAASIPQSLGLWSVATFDRETVYCANSGTPRLSPDHMVAVFCPVDNSPSGEWNLRIDLTGATMASSSELVDEFVPGEYAAWTLSADEVRDGFWVELRPDWPARLFYSVNRDQGGAIAGLLSNTSWLVFYCIMLIATVRLRFKAAATLPPNMADGRHLGSAMLVIVAVAFATCLALASVSVLSALSESHTADQPHERIAAILGLSTLVGLSLSFWKKRVIAGGIFALSVIALSTAYFGPKAISIETDQTLTSWPERFAIQVWPVNFGYINHLILGALAFAVAVYALATCLGGALRTLRGSPGKRSASATAVAVLGSIMVGASIAAHWQWVAFEQWNNRSLVPESASEPFYISEAMLTYMPWFSNGIVYWIPVVLYLAVIVVFFAYLVHANKQGASSRVVMQGSAAESILITVLFSAAVVGTYGSYRGVPVPAAFLVTLIIMQLAWKCSKNRASEIEAYASSLDSVELEAIQKTLLESSRHFSLHTQRVDSVEKRYEKGSTSTIAFVTEKILQPLVECHNAPPPHAIGPSSQLTEQELAIAIGPRPSWWLNALYATRLGGMVATPFVAYDLYLAFTNDVFAGLLEQYFGVLSVLHWIAAELLVWLVGSFVLGAFWTRLPGRRGVHKGLVLGGVASVAGLVDFTISGIFQQIPGVDTFNFAVLLIAFLGFLGVILDVSTLKKIERERWEFVNYLRLRETKWLASYGLTVVLIFVFIARQVAAGEPLTAIPVEIVETFGNSSAQS